MRPTSALHPLWQADEDMTCAAEESAEAGNRNPAVTQQILSPVDAPLFTMFRKTKTHNVATEWLVDSLDQAASNAVAEGSSATFTPDASAVRLLNYAQISREEVEVSDSQRAVRPAGIKDTYRYQIGKAAKQWKRDVEHDIVAGNTASAASTRSARGIHRWIGGFSDRTAIATGSNTANNIQEDDVNTRLQSIWVAGGMADFIVCTPTQKNAISSTFAGSANSRRSRPATDNRVTNVVDFYDSDFGNVKVLPHRWFTSAAPGTLNLQRVTYFLQSDKWILGFLRPPKNIPLAKIGSAERGMIEGEWTLICMHPSANSFISGHASGLDANNFSTN
jgi:hypothetical protein